MAVLWRQYPIRWCGGCRHQSERAFSELQSSKTPRRPRASIRNSCSAPNHVWLRRRVVRASATFGSGRVPYLTSFAVEHNISTKENKPEQPARRPDLSTFFSTLELVDTSDPQAHTNAHALPQPENVAAAFRLLANAFDMMRGRPADEQGDGGADGSDLLASMIEQLRQHADDPPSELKGVPDSFLDELERVPNKTLKPSDTCPICVNPFLEGT